MPLCLYGECLYAECLNSQCLYGECLCVFMLSVFMLNVVVPQKHLIVLLLFRHDNPIDAFYEGTEEKTVSTLCMCRLNG